MAAGLARSRLRVGRGRLSPSIRPGTFTDCGDGARASSYEATPAPVLVVAEGPSRYDGPPHGRQLDRELRWLARGDSAGRRVLGLLVARFVATRGYERLGFARLDDYGAERLGWSGRQLRDVARVAVAMSRLPAMERAFRDGTLDWSKARILVSVACSTDEEKWLKIAARTDAGTLGVLTANARAARREEHDIGGGIRPGACPQEDGPLEDPVAETTADEGDDELVLLRIPCSRKAIRLWHEAKRLAPLLVGRSLAQWQVAQAVAAEASSAPGRFADVWDQEPWRIMASGESDAQQSPSANHRSSAATANPAADSRETARADASATKANAHEDDSTCGGGRTTNECAAGQEVQSRCAELAFENELERLELLDARGLDAAMRRVRTAMQQRHAQLGSSLSVVLETRLFRDLGFSSFAAYVVDRLGIPERTARELVRVSRAADRASHVLAAAWSAGELSWLQTQALLPVARPWNSSAWVRRAAEVTLRRLRDEVDWVLERMQLDPLRAAAMPPPPDHDLAPSDPDDRQTCADEASVKEQGLRRARLGPRNAADASDRQTCADAASPNDAPAWSRDDLFGVLGRFRVVILAPKAVSQQFRSVMQAFAHPTEPRWIAFERMLEQVLLEWRRQPRHRDPVFERDDYRCTVPGCSSRRNLHDHHIVPRSMGGKNDLANRTAVCAWHHLRGIHRGRVSASGEAPDGIDWELGPEADGTSFLRLRGDRYRRAGE